MKTHITFTLFDGSRHDDIASALNHCQEQMGAEMRDTLIELTHMAGKPLPEYTAAIRLVEDKKYDDALRLYLKWRDEYDELIAFDSYGTEEG